MTFDIQIRKKRQATLPAPLLEELGVEPGDSLSVEVKGKKAIVRPKKQIALDALKELQRIFKESGIPEKEFQDAVEKDRLEAAEKYAEKSS